jgi:dTDP-4-amino-4,6-dideoxygalactose transaminase
MTSARIHLSPPHMTMRERRALVGAFDSNWIAPAGPALDEFEARLRSVAETEAAVAVSSGTAALHLALRVLGIEPGDIVMVPTVTFVASANAVRYVGAVPHFIDCDPRTGNIDPEQLRRAIDELDSMGRRPAAVMTVDLYGACANYSEIISLCSQHDIPIIEDAAEAIGASHIGRAAGSFGSLAAFSFNGNKLVTTGGGGALVGPAELIERARFLASQAREPVRHFEHNEIGYAYRLSNLSAALGCAQLERLDNMVEQTRSVHRRYVDELSAIEGLRIINQDGDGRGNGWLTVAMIDTKCHPSPHQICETLARDNIEARPAWKPMHLQPLYASNRVTGGAAAEQHFRDGLCLPSGSNLTESDQSRVIESVRRALEKDNPIELSTVDVRVERPRQHQDNRVATN